MRKPPKDVGVVTGVVTWFPVVCPGLFHTKHLGVRARCQPSRCSVNCAFARLALVPAPAGVLN